MAVALACHCYLKVWAVRWDKYPGEFLAMPSEGVKDPTSQSGDPAN
ncbi:uncharacterized protein CLUP02_07105 [Colletotrichum lupini]|uniref:Uncharacterized protein n=1 Tax=Colletotrichum lupini TaxID=145971 RepID=A0A9Q8SQC1_9PEZI|nr:uncharacterized protein CLUP02_07105 [Colletotrichum lupini]UQC81619.1 hypothetical protein CLUP02_07105 [Colletotrichum lupini]